MRRYVSTEANRDLFFHLHVQVKIEFLLLPVINGMRHDIPNLGIGQHLEISPLELFHGELVIDIPV